MLASNTLKVHSHTIYGATRKSAPPLQAARLSFPCVEPLQEIARLVHAGVPSLPSDEAGRAPISR
jgi:hypothetical protein